MPGLKLKLKLKLKLRLRFALVPDFGDRILEFG